MNAAVDHPGEMHAEEWESRIGNRVDQMFHQLTSFGHQLIIFAAERDNLRLRIHTAHSRHPVAVQTAAIDQESRANLTLGGDHYLRMAVISNSVHPATGANLSALFLNQFIELGAHRRVADDSG